IGLGELALRADIDVALEGGAIRASTPIRAEPSLCLVPAIPRAVAAGEGIVASLEGIAIDPIGPCAEVSAVLRAHLAAKIAARRLELASLGSPGVPGDDVDDPVDRIGSPERGSRAADHLDALDVRREHLVRIPEYPGEIGRVDAAAVDEDEQLVGAIEIAAAGRYRVLRGIDLRHLQIRGEAQHLGEAPGPGAHDLIVRDDVYGSRSIPQLLGIFGDGGHFDLPEL